MWNCGATDVKNKNEIPTESDTTTHNGGIWRRGPGTEWKKLKWIASTKEKKRSGVSEIRKEAHIHTWSLRFCFYPNEYIFHLEHHVKPINKCVLGASRPCMKSWLQHLCVFINTDYENCVRCLEISPSVDNIAISVHACDLHIFKGFLWKQKKTTTLKWVDYLNENVREMTTAINHRL